ncbi:decapping mRNA 2 isoform X2 [Tachypleus tridentatus]|uniref:decapping mRNA 2 isoform X2 n=1 Tax=Tachypleus tridentatus TaxID=6853 RepID=UPI003FD2387A
MLESHPGFEVSIPLATLDDLGSRFIINVPEEERNDLVRICFQIELAHWFYLDFYCSENPNLHQCNMKEFTHQIFNHIPFLKEHAQNTDDILESWKMYKMAVPTYGAILLDENMEYVLEETGFDISKLIDKNDFIEHVVHDRLVRLYVITGIPRDTKFQPKTRKEIKSISWFHISDLPSHKKDLAPKTNLGMGPNTFFMVMPFIKPLRKWICYKQQRLFQEQHNGAKTNQTRNKKTAEIIKQKQQQVYAQIFQDEFVEYLQGKGSRPRDHRNLSASPSRIQRLKSNQPSNRDREKHSLGSLGHNDSKTVERSYVFNGARNSHPTNTSEGTMHQKDTRNEQEEPDKISVPDMSAPSWVHFTLDRKTLMSCFDF